MSKRNADNLGLTQQQQLFVVEYLVDLNATQAAIRAGYSEKTARQQAARLLSNVNIQNAIAHQHGQRLEKVSYTADTLLNELMEENRADHADLYDEEGNLKPIHEWPKVWRRGLVTGIDVEELYEGRGETREKVGEVRKLKLSDRLKRKELLGKHIAVQAFKEKVEHDVSDPLKELMKQIGGTAIRPNSEGENQ